MKDPGELLSKLSVLEPSKETIDTLIALVREAFQKIQLLEDEIAILKNQKPRPKIEPSKLEKTDKTNNAEGIKKNWTKGSKNQKLVIDKEEKIEVPANQIPHGSTFKGYKEFVVQELVIIKQATRYLLAQWEKPDGTYIAAKPPEATGGGHFGPGLQQYILHQHHANRVPQNRIQTDLNDKGIAISEGQVENILKEAGARFQLEKESLLPAGLQAESSQADDTGARHKGKNGVATVICNKFFSYFKSSNTKSRINFLEILCSGNIEYTITQEMLDYIKDYKLAPSTLNIIEQLLGSRFATCTSNHFGICETWKTFLQKHCFGKTTQRILTEGALIGTLITRETVTLETIFMSDGAGQFALLKHVLCWIHIERSIKRLIPLNEQDRVERDQVLDHFWTFYRELKAYKASTPEERDALKLRLSYRFDEIFSFRATEAPLAQALKKIRDHKSELMLVLEHPDIPLHNNASENDIREYVTKRKISGGTRSDEGRDARDTFTSLYKTCKKLGISFWDYLTDRINKVGKIPFLAELIRKKIKLAAAGP